MQGTMLWFNETKDLGSILTDEGERLPVHGSCFAEGVRPRGRCVGTPVAFQPMGSEEDRRAEDVHFVPVVSPRRARTHRFSYRTLS